MNAIKLFDVKMDSKINTDCCVGRNALLSCSTNIQSVVSVISQSVIHLGNG